MLALFKTLIRPILEYGNSVWKTALKSIEILLNIQRKFTKHIKGLNEVPYEERLDPLTTNTIFYFNKNSRLRGHNLKISKQRVNKTKFASFFFKSCCKFME